MNVTYYQKQRGAVRLAKALQEAGWTIHGYKPDRSDPMTDYYDPASWFGIATRDGLTVVVNLSWGWNGETVVGDKSPYATFPEAVRSAGITWQPNPPRCNWHVERDRQIIASGVGIGTAGEWDRARAERALQRILRSIEEARRRDLPRAGEPVPRVQVRRNRERNGVEVRFAQKPPEHVRAELKANGFRWSRRQGLWYARYSPQTWTLACRIAGKEPGEGAPVEEAGDGSSPSAL